MIDLMGNKMSRLLSFVTAKIFLEDTIVKFMFGFYKYKVLTVTSDVKKLGQLFIWSHLNSNIRNFCINFFLFLEKLNYQFFTIICCIFSHPIVQSLIWKSIEW